MVTTPDIKSLTLIELKALQRDQMVELKRTENNIDILQREIEIRESVENKNIKKEEK
jgi:hypothetical protein